ncbi:universal stress protein [Paraburkholderia aspalathi]|uniref:Nucleotide-binding universal stress protein, UspA family n=1 Tax=Paraburkholderia aspalathi TaxID=1324617 RepID=A0A1I7EJA0_9BURK|nr:universal stress protein [Paraburkholderia aspalathi]SFU23989.1 Nucleotide-binding universal stress protein, UspA family [Paraburkholderia aspalathi]
MTEPAKGSTRLADGVRLGQEVRAQMHVLSVVDNPAWMQGADTTSAVSADLVCDSAKSVLEEGLQKLTARGINAAGHFAICDPLDQIPFFARDLYVDLIVVRHHRTSRLARWWGGRTDGLLLDRVSCSMLVTYGRKRVQAQQQAELQASAQWRHRLSIRNLCRHQVA